MNRLGIHLIGDHNLTQGGASLGIPTIGVYYFSCLFIIRPQPYTCLGIEWLTQGGVVYYFHHIGPDRPLYRHALNAWVPLSPFFPHPPPPRGPVVHSFSTLPRPGGFGTH